LFPDIDRRQIEPDCPTHQEPLSDWETPDWWVGDNTVRSLIARKIAVVTHTRNEGRPAAVKVRAMPLRGYALGINRYA